MTTASSPHNTFWCKAWIAVRFIVFGIGGFCLLMFCWMALVEALTPHGERLMNPFLALPLSLVGALMMLFGGGVWGRWAYLWVFLSTPLVVSVFLFLPSRYTDWGGKGFVVFSLPMVASYLFVREYYRRRTNPPSDMTHQ